MFRAHSILRKIYNFVFRLKVICQNEKTEMILWPQLSILHFEFLLFLPPTRLTGEGGDLSYCGGKISAMKNS